MQNKIFSISRIPAWRSFSKSSILPFCKSLPTPFPQLKNKYPLIHFFSTISKQNLKLEIEEIIKTKGNKTLRGRLVICPTPLGNVKDVSIRQYESLLDCDIIACEDVQVTEELFKIFKEKNLKEKFYENFEITLSETKEEKVSESEATEEEMFFERLAVPTSISQFKQAFPELDVFAFMQNPDLINDESLFNEEDKFKFLIRQKVKELQENKGRGILVRLPKEDAHQRISKLITCLKYNFKVAIVANKGTPVLADTGYEFIDEAHAENILIEPLPGPNEFSIALTLSGFPSDRFLFRGELPEDSKERKDMLEELKESGMTTVFHEKTENLLEILESIKEIYGEEQLVSLEGNLKETNEHDLRGRIGEVYEKLERNRKLIDELKKAILVVAPHSENYNRTLMEKAVAEKKKDNKHMVNVNHLIQVMQDKLEAEDVEVAKLLSDILLIPKKRAMRYVHRKKAQEE